MNEELRAQVKRVEALALGAGILCLVLCGLGAAGDRRDFFISYLFGYLFWLGLAFGCLVVAMIHHLTGGRWGFAIRHFLESGFRTLPLMALLFVPILFGIGDLYPWAHAQAVSADKVLRHRQLYLNPTLFTLRAVLFFGVWIWLGHSLRRWSARQNETKDPGPTRRLRTLSGPGLVIYTLTATLAYVDWVMSLEADWYSTLFAVLVIIGQILAALSFMILLLVAFRRTEPLRRIVTETHFHHLGNLLLAFVMMWAYLAFSQLLIIWSGNLPREIAWYLHRSAGGWRWVAAALALFHFFVPFFLLLFRGIKQRLASLAAIAAMVLLMELADVFWLVVPSFYPAGPAVHWMNFAAPIGLGGVWLAAFAFYVRQGEFLAKNDPRFEGALHPV